jgi:hypothetical protein
MAYFLKEGYQERERPSYLVDSPRRDGIIGQPMVYPAAARLARELDCSSIVDIGCGWAGKLVELHPEFELVGIDYGPNIEHCRTFGFGTWIEWDIERDPLPDVPVEDAVIVCADVIEHLVDPSKLLHALRTLLQGAAAGLLSTPERDLTRGVNHFGPPQNVHHVREWNMDEFRRLLESAGLPPVRLELTESGTHSPRKHTILATLPGAKLS